MERIDLKNIDRANWKTYRFDQIAEKISEPVDPNTTYFNIYVGLEHLDSESIHITRKGTPSEVSGGKLKCYPGDIIFGKRRAYQRKAAIADFEGICSAHAFVLRAKPDVIIPELFPFFLHSDSFMHCAVDISVGGLSPTINWGQLKEQEFLLPPKEQQAQLTEILWTLDEVNQTDNRLLESAKLLCEATKKEKVLGREHKSKCNGILGNLPIHWSLIRMEEMFERVSKKNRSLNSNNVLTISAIDGLINQEEYFKKSVASKDLTTYYLLTKGDFAYNKSYSEGYPAGAVKCLNKYPEGVVSPLYICFRSKKLEYNKYFEYLFDSGFLNTQILSIAKEGARNHGLLNVTANDFFNLIIPLPPLSEICQIVNEISIIEEIIKPASDNVIRSKVLQKSLINQIFSL